MQGNQAIYALPTIDPVSNKMYLGCQLMPSGWSSQPFTLKTYEMDRSTGNFVRLITGTIITVIQEVTDNLSMSLMGLDAGQIFWASPNTGYNTDGEINFFNNAATSSNTGDVEVTTLEEYDLSTSLSTGPTKPNDPIDPDFYSPTGFTDFNLCNVTFTTDCVVDQSTTISGTTRHFEFYLDPSVRNNPVITQIYAGFYSGGTQVSTLSSYSPPFDGYNSGYITGLTNTSSGAYTFKVLYYSGGTLLNPLCAGITS
jgi:hypothetical protein